MNVLSARPCPSRFQVEILEEAREAKSLPRAVKFGIQVLTLLRRIIAVSLLGWNGFQYCSGYWHLLVMRQVVVQRVHVAGLKSSCLRLGVCTICWRTVDVHRALYTHVCVCTHCSSAHKKWLHVTYSSRTRALGEWQSGTSSPLKHNHKLGLRREISQTWVSAHDTLGANSSFPTFQLKHPLVKRQYCLSRDCTIMAIPCALATQ